MIVLKVRAAATSCVMTLALSPSLGNQHNANTPNKPEMPQPKQTHNAESLISLPCPAVEERSISYFESHNFFAVQEGGNTRRFVRIGNRDGALLPSKQILKLDRHSIRKYTHPRHLSLLKSYSTFRIEGQLGFETIDANSCRTTLDFAVDAFEYVWSVAAIDDGKRTPFVSNGELERLYLNAFAGAIQQQTR